MSTRAKIAIRRKDGSFQGIYCHFDGYLNYAGEILEKFYDTTEKVENLISLGNVIPFFSHFALNLSKCF